MKIFKKLKGIYSKFFKPNNSFVESDENIGKGLNQWKEETEKRKRKDTPKDFYWQTMSGSSQL